MRTLTMAFLFMGIWLAFGGESSDYHLKHADHKVADHRKSRSHDEVGSTCQGVAQIGIERR